MYLLQKCRRVFHRRFGTIYLRPVSILLEHTEISYSHMAMRIITERGRTVPTLPYTLIQRRLQGLLPSATVCMSCHLHIKPSFFCHVAAMTHSYTVINTKLRSVSSQLHGH